MNAQKRKALGLGFIGLILVVFGIKFMPVFLQTAGQQSSMSGKPVVLFFSLDDPCECMVELTQRAEQQMASWTVERKGGISVVRIPMEQRKDLEAKYKIFRAPSLVLVDAQDQVAWRQDYPLIEGGPFKLEELEAAVEVLLLSIPSSLK
jgi:hypothetical protein